MKRNGFSLVEMIVAATIATVLCGISLSAITRVRSSSEKTECTNRMRSVALALHQVVDQNGRFPAGCSVNEGNSQTLYASFHTSLLPHLEQDRLAQFFQEDYRKTKWHANPAGHRAFAVPVTCFICPSDSRIAVARYVEARSLTAAFTSYLGVCGADCMVPKPDGSIYTDSTTRLQEIADGLSNTIVLGERPPADDLTLGWWYAGVGQQDCGSTDMILGVEERNFSRFRNCPAGEMVFEKKSYDDRCAVYRFWSPHPGGPNFAFADGSVRAVSYSAKTALKSMATRSRDDSIAEP
jgi:prepilin-type processing-associated H-X9-DG protein/prepilin-type N-terminal cleavage/methylation domain-containing protein